MGQVASQDTSVGSFDANSGTVSHIVDSGEGLIVGCICEVTDSGKRPDDVFWDVASSNQQLTRFGTVLLPGSGKLLIDVFFHTGPDAKTALVTVNIEGSEANKTAICCISVSNHNTTTMLSDRQVDDGTDAGGSVGPTQDANDLAIAFAAHFKSDGDFTATGDSVELHDSIQQGFDVGLFEGDTAGATTLSWTQAESAENATYGFTVEEGVTLTDPTVPDMAPYIPAVSPRDHN